MQRAVNPQTGEVLFLVNNKWTSPAQTAKNDAGDTAYLVGNKWEVVQNNFSEQPGGIASVAPRAANVMTADEYRAQVAAREEKGYDRTLGGTLGDAGIVALKGAIGLPEAGVGLADIFTGGRVGKALEGVGFKPKEAREILDTYYSEPQQYANRQVKEAEGFLPTIGKAIQYPSTILTTVGESLPQMLGGAGIARTILKAAPKVGAVVAGGIGEGVLGAGSSASQIRQQTEDKLLTGKQALSAAGSGLGTAAFGIAGGKLASKLGLDDIDTLLVGGGAQTGSKSVKDFAKRATASGISEGVFEEMPQSAQETMWINYATDQPLLQGVPEAAGMGLVTGATMGVGATALGGRRKQDQKPDVPPAPEAGITSLITPPPAPPASPALPAGPAEAIQAPGSESQDTQVMLDELINSVNYPQEKAPEVKAEKPVEAPPVEEPKTESLKLYRGVPKGQESRETVGGALFMSPDRKVAEEYAGPNGNVTEEERTFDNILQAPDWVSAKKQLGLPQSATMANLVNAAREAGHDGVTFNTTNGQEYIAINKPAKAEPTLKEQYDKAVKINFMASDAFRDRRITQEQYDKIQADYERLKTEYQSSIPKATLTPIQQEATDIADRLEELGQNSFVTGMRSAIERNQVNKDNLEFYRSRLKQEQAKQNALDEGIERPSEKFEWTKFFRDDPKDLNKLKLFNSKAPPAVKQALQTVTDTLQALTNRLNDEGYTMYGTPSSTIPQEIKNLRSQIQMRSAGGVKLINAFEALDKGFNRSKKTTNQQNLDAAIQDIKVDAAEAQKVLQRSIPEPEEVVNARTAVAEANKRVETLEYKSGSLWGALMGKLDPEEVREIFGPNPSLGEKKLQVTKKSGKRGTYISEMAENSLLDPFLPIGMRRASGNFDAAEAGQYIKDAVANKDYLPHDVKTEIENIYKAVEPLGDLIDEYLTIEEQNRELQIAFDEQREIDQAAEIVEPESEDRPAEPSEGQTRELKLTAATPDEIRAKVSEIDRLTKENERLSKEVERKAKADEEAKDFVLTGSNREADQASARGQKDIFTEEPKSTGSKSLDALRGVKFTPDEDDKKAIAVYKKIKENNPEADLDEDIANPNNHLPVEEIENRKGLKIGDLVYEKGDPDPNIVITVSEEDVTLVDPNTGKPMGSVDIENVSKDPIPYDYKFDFGYGEINVNVNRWMNRKDEWSVEMSGPGASETGYRNELGLTFKSNRGTPAFEDWVEKVVRIQTKEMAEPRKLAKGKKGKKEAQTELIEEAPKDNKQEIADLRKEQKTLMLQIIKAGMAETPEQEARMAKIDRRINELEGKPAKKLVEKAEVKQRSVEEIEEEIQDLRDELDGEFSKDKRMVLIKQIGQLQTDLGAAEYKAQVKAEKEEEAAEEAIRNKAEAEIDEGPIGQAIAKIENGDIETKAQIRTFIAKLERDGTLDDVEEVREGLSDREQDASEVLDTLNGLLDEARDTAIDERVDELLEESAQEKPIDTDLFPALGSIEALAKEYNGKVVFGDDDLGLVLAYGERTGEPLYVPYVKDAMFRNDIEQFPASSFKLSDADYKKLVDAKQALEKTALEEHQKAPFLTIRDGVTASKGIAGNVLAVAKGWSKMLNLTGNIYIMTDEEALASKDKFTGPHRAIGYIGFLSEPGVVKKVTPTDYIIVLRKSTSVGKTLEVLSHELGHIHEKQAFDNVDIDTKNKVIGEFNKWFAKNKPGTSGALIESMRAKRMGRATKGDRNIPVMNMKNRQYWLSFTEWYADQISRWATTNDKPVGVIEQFFAKLANAIRRYFNSVKAAKYLPNETFVQYLDKVTAVTDLTPKVDILPGDQISLFASEDIGGRVPPNTTRRNYQGGEAPEPAMEIPEMSRIDDLIQKLGDKNIDMKRLIEAVNKAGKTIDERFNAYKKEENYHGRLAKRTEDFLDDELRPVLEEMKSEGVSLEEIEKYLYNRHAKEANAYIAKINPVGFPEAGSGISDSAADTYMKGLTQDQITKYDAISAKIDAIVKKTQQVLVDNGVETQETIKQWNETYKYYVPLQRDNLDFVHTGRGVMGGFATRGSSTKRRVGSDKPVIDIVANIAMMRERALRRSEQARVGRALLGMAIKYPNPGFWLAINPDAIKDREKLVQELQSLGLKPEDAENIIQEPRQPMFDKKSGLVKYQVNSLLRNSPNVFPVRVNGQDRFIIFNPNEPRAKRMAEAVRNLDTDSLGSALGVVGMVTRWIASVNTQYNVVFGAVNFLRDVQGAALNLSTTELSGKEAEVMAEVLPALRAIYRSLRGKGATTKDMEEMQKVFERYQLAGGQTGYQNQFTKTEQKANIVEREIKRLNRGNVRKSVDAVFNWLSDYNDAIENAVRLAAFKTAIENGMSDDAAASLAKNLTVNFNRKGAKTGIMSALFAFFNAAVQGTARLIQTIRGPMGKKIIYGGMLLGSIQAIALAMAGYDDDEPPEFVKDKNLIIPLPFTDKKYLTIPMPLGFNVFPGLGRLATETMLIKAGFTKSRKGVGDKMGSAMSLILDSFNPLGSSGNPLLMIMPTIVDPFAALYSNVDAFGRPIYKEDRGTAPTPGFQRSRENASFFSQKLAEALNWATSPAGTQYTKGWLSPTADQIDYFIGQVTGGVGREIMKTGEFLKSKAVTQEEVPAYKIPVVGRFYGEADSPAATRQRFYDNVAEMAKHENEIKSLRKEKKNPSEYVKSNPEASLWQRANNVENQLSKLRKEKKALLEKDAPREAVKRKEDQMIKLMKEFNEQVEKRQ